MSAEQFIKQLADALISRIPVQEEALKQFHKELNEALLKARDASKVPVRKKVK